MSQITIGLIGIGVLFLLMFLRMPIGFAMALVGFVGLIYLGSLDGALYFMGMETFSNISNYNLSVLPLFMLMSQFAFRSGISEKLFGTAHKWLGHLPGGLAMATVAGCAGFGAICGSGIATAMTFGPVVLPEMKKYNYEPGLATGSIAAGGTLAILIPPSSLFIVYGIITQQSIGKLFIAGAFPGIVLASLFMITIFILVKRNPNLARSTPAVSIREKLASLQGIGETLILFLLVMGGLYGGIFTANEAAGVGAAGALLIGLARRRFTWEGFISAFVETVKTTGMVFVIIIGAMIFNRFLALTRIPNALVGIAGGLSIPPLATIAVIVVIYMVLGALFDELAITFLTVPIFFPVILAQGIDPIWFGVIFCICMEMGMILPPVGINVFVIAGVAKDVPMYTIYRGIGPFIIPMVITIGILMAFPQLALFLPSHMK